MKLKSLLTTENKQKLVNLILNVGATLIFNCVLQFLCYPMFEKKLGTELNGVVLTLISVVAVTAGSLGAASNYSRLVKENVDHPSNGDYNVILLIGGILVSIVGIVYLWIKDLLSPTSAISFSLLLFFTVLRYYSDVEFKIKTNFLRYFIFYLFISVGYVLGIILFNLTNIYWAIAILSGEVLGVIYAVFASDIFRKNLKISKNFKIVLSSVSILLLSSLLENLTLNADRLILLSLTSGTAVSHYYVASLFGKVIALLTVPINSLIISYLIRYNGELSKKMWTIFVVASTVLGAICLVGCLVGSIWILPLLYDWFAVVKPILVPSILAQVLFFLSSVLLVVLLRFFGEKKQFTLNLIYGIIFFVACIIFTKLYGLNGFVYTSLFVNALRFLIVVIFGFIAKPKKLTPSTSEQKTVE